MNKNTAALYKYIIIILCFLIIVGVAFFLLRHSGQGTDNDSKFSKSNWDQRYINQIAKGPYLLSKDLEISIAPPPENNSQEVKDEIAYLKGLYAYRSDDAVERIRDEDKMRRGADPYIHYGLLPDDTSKTHTLNVINIAFYETTYFLLREKQRYARLRPSQIDKSLKLVVKDPSMPSYPSLQAGQSYAVGMVMSFIFRSDRAELKEVALDIGMNREIAGVNFPSDSEAGVTVAKQVMSHLGRNRQYRREIEAARAEW